MKAALLAAVLAAGAASSPAPGTIERGGLTFGVPTGWQETAPARAARGGVSVTLGPRIGTGFVLQLSVIPTTRTAVDTRAVVEAQGRQLLATAVERTLSVTELRGEHGAGHYFALTDRSPAPGEFEYLMQGALLYGTRLVSFTLLTHTADGTERAAALGLLREARPAP